MGNDGGEKGVRGGIWVLFVAGSRDVHPKKCKDLSLGLGFQFFDNLSFEFGFEYFANLLQI